METLSQTDWQRVKEAFDQALELPAAKRAALIASLPGEDQRATLQQMLAATDAEDGLLDQPAVAALQATPAGELPEPGWRIGAYRVLSLLGRGGTGEVWLAERADGLYEQKVAVKRLRAEAAQQWEAFKAERQILARLEHPGIARLLDAGLDVDGRPYTVVEYVPGQSLLEHCALLDLRQRVLLFLQICEAVAYAHTQLVIHRDLKPGNVMVTGDGRIKLLDFGVAKLLDPNSFRGDGQTQAAAFTPDYAAPEQLEGGAVSTATDVYALGVVLFELLVGRRPWSVGELPLALALDRLLNQPAPQASTVAAAMPDAKALPRLLAGDLDAIIARSLRKQPQDRYATAEALGDDLRRHLRGEPVQARSGARLYVAGRFLSRNRWSLAAAAGVLLALLGAVGGYAMHRQRQTELRLELAQRELRRGDALNDLLSLLLRSADRSADAVVSNPQEVLKSASERVFRQYEDRPSALAGVVLQLGDLFITADDTEAAGSMLEQYLQRFGAQADPADLAEARLQLSTVAVRRGDIPRAAALLADAQSFWNLSPERYRQSLLSSRLNQAEIERGQGQVDQAIVTLRSALAERLREPGGHETSIVFYQNLASALSSASRLDESAQVLGAGWAQVQALGQSRTPEALTMLNSMAVLATNRGELDEAALRYRDCAALRRELYGESVILASSLIGLGRALALKGQVDEALPLFDQARVMAEHYAGPRSLVVVLSQLYTVDARLLQQDTAAAEARLAQLRTFVQGQFPPEHPVSARLDETEGRLRLAQHRLDEAALKFSAAEAVLRKLGNSARAFLAQTRLSQAQLALLREQPAEAVTMSEEAVALRDQFAAPGSWLRAEAASLLGNALIQSAQAPRGLVLLRRAVEDLRRTLGDAHPVTRQAQQWLQQATSAAAGIKPAPP